MATPSINLQMPTTDSNQPKPFTINAHPSEAKVTISHATTDKPNNHHHNVPNPNKLNVYVRQRRGSAQANISPVPHSPLATPTTPTSTHSPNSRLGHLQIPKITFRSKSTSSEQINGAGTSEDHAGSVSAGVETHGGRRASLLDGIKAKLPHKKVKSKAGNLSAQESEESDQAKPLFVNTKLANIIDEERSKYDFASRRASCGPMLEFSEEEEDGSDHETQRPRSNSGSGQNLLVLRKTSRPQTVLVMGRLDSDQEPYRQFLLTQTCYDLVPYMSKMILLDTSLSIRKAFLVFMEHRLDAAPIWNGAQVVAVLTKTDFLKMLHQSNPQTQNELAVSHNLGWWLQSGLKAVAKSSPKDSLSVPKSVPKVRSGVVETLETTKLLTAANLMHINRIRHVPVLEKDSCAILALLSAESIVTLVQKKIKSLPLPAWMRLPIRALQVGTWDDLATVSATTKLSDAVDLLLQKRLSCLPVVEIETSQSEDDDESKKSIKLVDALTKSDIFAILSSISAGGNFAYEDILQLRVSEALLKRDHLINTSGGGIKNLARCQTTDNLVAVVDVMSHMESRWVFAIDGEDNLAGVISTCDVLEFITRKRSEGGGGDS